MSSIRHVGYILERCLKDVLQGWLSNLGSRHLLDICKISCKMSCLSEARCFACPSQKTITCSKLATETQKQGVNTI